MSLKRKRAVVLVENNYQEMEVWYPLYRLQEAGLEVIVAGREAGKTYTSKLGYPVVSTQTISSLHVAEFDAVVVPGGYAPDYLRSYPEVLKFVHGMDAAGKVVAAICHAGWVLCSAGILKGRHATSFVNIKDDMVNAGAIWEDSAVVVDKNLVTSRKPIDLPAFMQAILKLLD
jgi:protease I